MNSATPSLFRLLTTPALFKKYKKVEDFAGANLSELQRIIKSTGFFRAKARSIKGLANKIVKDYKGQVLETLDELVTLPGVGRKTANVVLGHAFNTPMGTRGVRILPRILKVDSGGRIRISDQI